MTQQPLRGVTSLCFNQDQSEKDLCLVLCEREGGKEREWPEVGVKHPLLPTWASFEAFWIPLIPQAAFAVPWKQVCASTMWSH